MRRRHHTCDEVSVSGGRTVLDCVLSPERFAKAAARRAWQIFKENPFDSPLRPHKIYRLSALYGRTINAVDIEADLRSTFYVEGHVVISIDIGTHEIYRG